MEFLSTFSDWGLLALRLVLGTIFIVHGLAKLSPGSPVGGIAGWTKLLVGLGVPAPGLMAWGVALLEVIGGALLIIGFGARTLAALFTLNMLVATWAKFKWGAKFTQFDGTGYEFDLLLIVAQLVLLTTGAGALSLDAALNLPF